MRNNKDIIKEHLFFIKNDSVLAPKLNPILQRSCNKINELCAIIIGKDNMINYNWIETGLPDVPKYIKYNGSGKWYIKKNNKWTFIPNNINEIDKLDL